jgi:hypothetical protein
MKTWLNRATRTLLSIRTSSYGERRQELSGKRGAGITVPQMQAHHDRKKTA